MPSEMPTAVAVCCCCERLKVVKGKTFTTALTLAVLALLVLGPLARRTVVSVSCIGMSLKELDLLASVHRRKSLDVSKEASVR